LASLDKSSVERFRRLESDCREAALFHGAMTDLNRRPGESLADTLVVPPNALIVDIGGCAGKLPATVLARNGSAQGILFDLPHPLAHARPVIRRRGAHERCSLQEGSVFDGVPPQGDLYMVKSVLHDWGDKQAALILDRRRQTMKPRALLVLVERPWPERVGTNPDDRPSARSDLNMLRGPAGRERTLAQHGALIERFGLVLRHAQKSATGLSALTVEVAPLRLDSRAAAARLFLPAFRSASTWRRRLLGVDPSRRFALPEISASSLVPSFDSNTKGASPQHPNCAWLPKKT
jgi:hypothetical protein